MPNAFRLAHARRGAIILASGLVLAGAPAAAQAAAIDLGTAAPFAVLGGSAVSNTGTSVLNGDLGVSPTSALTGFDTAVVTGATHDADAVALKAQDDLRVAYDNAADEAVTLDLTGQDLGTQTLTPGAYEFSSSAQLTGQLTLDALGDPDAQFVFKIGTTLTTATASSVLLIGQANPCNVYWQVGSSATLGTSTAFKGTIMAFTSATLNTSATVTGRVLARNGAVTLDDNVIDASTCAPPVTTSPVDTTTPTAGTPTGGSPTGGSPTGTAPGAPVPFAPATPRAKAPPASRTTLATRKGTATLTRTTTRVTTRTTARARCTAGFTAGVSGRLIKKVVFTRGGRTIATRTGSPFRVYVPAGGKGTISARVTFKDATRAKTMKLAYRACAAAQLQPRRGPSRFTG